VDGSDIAVKNDSHNDTHQDSRKGDDRYRRVELITGTLRHMRRSDEERALDGFATVACRRPSC
jgi:hypothetical protein